MLVRKRTDSLEAYDTFLHGAEYFYHFTKEGNAQARALFEKTIELDPQYAEAYAWLGWTYFMAWVQQWEPGPQNPAAGLRICAKSARPGGRLTEGAHHIKLRPYVASQV